MTKQISIIDAEYFFKHHGIAVRLAGDFVRLSKGVNTIIKPVTNGGFDLSENDPKWIPLPAFLFS